jgi:hypothetical protein
MWVHNSAELTAERKDFELVAQLVFEMDNTMEISKGDLKDECLDILTE